jgi:peptidoglycan/LPS O-acetylase OafA/YrhL
MRNKRLDVLRSIAVLLVLFYHSDVNTRLANAGWAGVDLFFVLSGFLISGLLFTEYKKRGSINFKRFFIRRGLKLYPAFYFCILVAFLYQIVSHQIVGTVGQYLSEMAYFQNYGPFIWRHTWSLAVEEHFYILLPLFLLLLIRYSSNRYDPFRAIPWAFFLVATMCLAFRIATVLSIPRPLLKDWASYRAAFATTHCRMDSLFFGVLLGYIYHFRKGFLDRLLGTANNRIALTFLSAALLSCCLFFPVNHLFTLTAGFTLLYLGFGAVLTLCLYVELALPSALARPFNQIGKGFAYVGMYSYSIYLWHLAVKRLALTYMPRAFDIGVTSPLGCIAYMASSLVIGILMSQLIEYPILRLRDRIFPVMQGQPTA